MTRITESQMARGLIGAILANRENLNKYSNEVSTGLKVHTPGDTNVAGIVSKYKEALASIKGYRDRISNVRGMLDFQESIVSQSDEVLVRAKEIAAQAANETLGSEERFQMSSEIWALRDQLVSLANSKYQGKYIYGGADDDDPPFDGQTYSVPSSGSASIRYTFDSETGTSQTRTVNVTDSVSVTVNTPGSTVFNNAIFALERLGRSMSGYKTLPASGQPDGTGGAYTFPSEYTTQTQDIKSAMALLDTARGTDLTPERVSVGARLRRLDGAASLLDLSEANSQSVLSSLQDADSAVSISNLTQAQNALQASLQVTSRVLNLNILQYI